MTQDAVQEHISIAEAARRLGVSDTAVGKAAKSGRIKIVARQPKTNWPLVAWPQARDEWQANTDAAKRSHGGPQLDADPDEEPGATAEVAAAGGGASNEGAAAEAASKGSATYAQSRAVREAYQARLARLEYEEKTGKLIPVEQVKVQAFNVGRRVRDALLSLPDRVCNDLAAETDPLRINLRLTTEIRIILESLT
jgi:hypothetical protein